MAISAMGSAAGSALFSGGCHCGAVRFEVRVRELVALDCNCSICTKKGFLHVIAPREDFALLTTSDALATYTFGTHVAKHHFCKTCGIHAFYLPRSHPDSFDVNARALDDDAWTRFRIEPFDGKNWEDAVEQLGFRS
jgi:hypothetical protein